MTCQSKFSCEKLKCHLRPLLLSFHSSCPPPLSRAVFTPAFPKQAQEEHYNQERSQIRHYKEQVKNLQVCPEIQLNPWTRRLGKASIFPFSAQKSLQLASLACAMCGWFKYQRDATHAAASRGIFCLSLVISCTLHGCFEHMASAVGIRAFPTAVCTVGGKDGLERHIWPEKTLHPKIFMLSNLMHRWNASSKNGKTSSTQFHIIIVGSSMHCSLIHLRFYG